MDVIRGDTYADRAADMQAAKSKGPGHVLKAAWKDQGVSRNPPPKGVEGVAYMRNVNGGGERLQSRGERKKIEY